MKKKGTGYAHEMLLAIFFLMLVMVFLAKDSEALIAPMAILLGGGMVIGGLAVREPMVVAGGICMFGFALMFAKVFT